MSPNSPFTVERQGPKWAVKADEEVMILTRTRREAQRLAKHAAGALAPELRYPRRPPEPRSFTDDD